MLLTEMYIRISVTVLYANYVVTYDSYSGTITQKLFICPFGVVFFGLNKLMVEIQIILLTIAQSSCSQKGFDQQFIHFVGSIEIV